MAALAHTSPRDWPMREVNYSNRQPTLEERMRTGAAWPSREPPPSPLEMGPPKYSLKRKPRTPYSPYTPEKRPPLVQGDRGFERTMREVASSPTPSGRQSPHPPASGRDEKRKDRARATPVGSAKPFQLRADAGRALLSPRLNRWLEQQVGGGRGAEEGAGAAARNADISARQLRQQQKKAHAERDMKRCLMPLLRLIEETNTTAIKGDATAALYSLALNPANANAFVLTGAFRVLLDLCSETDPGIRKNVLNMLFALAESPLTRRILVQLNCIKAIVPHTRLKNPEVAKYATGTILNLCALEANRDDILADRNLVPALLALLAPPRQLPSSFLTTPTDDSSRSSARAMVSSDGAQTPAKGVDPRLQRDSMATLALLVDDNVKRKLHLLEHGGTIPTLLRVAADAARPNDIRMYALQSLESLLDIEGADFPRQALDTFQARDTLKTLTSILAVDDDLELLASALRIIRLLSSRLRSFKRTFVEPSVGGLRTLLDHAQRLTEIITKPEDPNGLTPRQQRPISPGASSSPSGGGPPRGTAGAGLVKSESTPAVVLLSVVSAVLSVAKSKRALMLIFRLEHCKTVMELCRSTHKRIRRGGGNLLQRLSTLSNSKLWLYESGATPLLLNLLAERPDEFVIHTATTTLAELAEEPSIRVPMVQAGVLSALVSLVFELGVPAVRFEAARALADLAEAVDNRLVIALRCGKALVSLLQHNEGDDPRTMGHAVRCYANLAEYAGHTSDCAPPFTGRCGAREHTEYGADSDDSEDDDDSDSEYYDSESEYYDSEASPRDSPGGDDTMVSSVTPLMTPEGEGESSRSPRSPTAARELQEYKQEQIESQARDFIIKVTMADNAELKREIIGEIGSEGSNEETSEYGTTTLPACGKLREEVVPLVLAAGSEEEEEEGGDESSEEEEQRDYYWDSAAGVALARNFNSHCLPQIHKRVAWSGALGLILSAADRQKVLMKGRKKSALEEMAKPSVDGSDEENEDEAASHVRNYAATIVRQLTLDIAGVHNGGKEPDGSLNLSTTGRSVTHSRFCPVCRGLSTTFSLP